MPSIGRVLYICKIFKSVIRSVQRFVITWVVIIIGSLFHGNSNFPMYSRRYANIVYFGNFVNSHMPRGWEHGQFHAESAVLQGQDSEGRGLEIRYDT